MKTLKMKQAFIEGRILTLEKILRNARIIDGESAAAGEVGVGSTVVLKDMEDGGEFEYTIVGSVETDPMDKKISNESPVGRAILGKRKGNVVEISVPAGLIKFKIMDVS